jgi:arsenate reductase
MKSIARNDNQITLVYSSKTRLGKRTRAHVAAVEDDKLQTIDVAETKLTGTQWAELAQGLNKTIKDLVNYEEADSEEEDQVQGDFDDNAYINILNHNPELFTHPIAILGEKMLQITNPTDIQQFIEVDSAGLEKKMMYDEPVISRQTNGEKFIEKNGEQKQEDSEEKNE